MTPDEKAKEPGIDPTAYQPIPNLAPVTRAGNIIHTFGHMSTGHKGKPGQAARLLRNEE